MKEDSSPHGALKKVLLLKGDHESHFVLSWVLPWVFTEAPLPGSSFPGVVFNHIIFFATSLSGFGHKRGEREGRPSQLFS